MAKRGIPISTPVRPGHLINNDCENAKCGLGSRQSGGCHSEHSEESLFANDDDRRETLRQAQGDSQI